MTSTTDPARLLLRHAVATLAYRGGKTLRGAPPEFAAARCAAGTRSAAEILAHVGDLLDWGLALAQGRRSWNDSTPLPWDDEVVRFYAALARFDEYLASDLPLESPPEKLFQGPVADALTHVGQLALLRRVAGAPVRGENYYKADIAAGTVGPEQPAPRFEFG